MLSRFDRILEHDGHTDRQTDRQTDEQTNRIATEYIDIARHRNVAHTCL